MYICSSHFHQQVLGPRIDSGLETGQGILISHWGSRTQLSDHLFLIAFDGIYEAICLLAAHLSCLSEHHVLLAISRDFCGPGPLAVILTLMSIPEVTSSCSNS